MKIILESIRKVLIEGRIEDVKKKYTNLDPVIIDFFVNGDPSGNQKYLEWLVKAMSDKNTTRNVGDYINNHEYEEGIWGETAGFLLNLIRRFHSLIPYLVHLENGEAVGTTDLYKYKVGDTDMIHYLMNDLGKAQERRDEKENLKKLEKDADTIYKNSGWLVVRPKTWEASCVYGAGTKWCTTSKETSSHFNRETNRNFLIYVINKSLPERDLLKKVAWQIPFRKNVDKIINPLSGEIDYNYIKLWNTEDTNISSTSSGYDYITSVPNKIKLAIFYYMKGKMDERFANMAYVEDERKQALIEHFGYNEEQAEEITEETWTHYGMNVYDIEDGQFAVADEGEVDSAKRDYAEQYIDDLGVHEVLSSMYDPERYISISGAEQIADEEADYRVDDMSDDDILDEAAHIHEAKPLLEEYNDLKSKSEDYDTDVENLDAEFEGEEITREEYVEALDRLEKDNKELLSNIDRLFDSIKSALREYYYDSQLEEMQDNPKSWLENMGYWDRDGLSKSAISRGLVDVDEDSLATDLADDFTYDNLTNGEDHSEVSIGNETYYIFPIG